VRRCVCACVGALLKACTGCARLLVCVLCERSCAGAGVRVLVRCYMLVLGVRGYWCVRACCGRSCVGVCACMSGRV